MMSRFGFAAAACVAATFVPVVGAAAPLDDMISPLSHAVLFEDPRHSTELRPLYVYHKLDDQFVTQGGKAQVYALQARFKIDDDLSIIANKDGYIDLDPNAVVPPDTGFADVSAGVKYSFWTCDDSIATAGLTYEIPLGDENSLQGQGDGVFNPFVSAGYTVDGWNFMGHSGFRFAVDSADSSFFDANLHVSYNFDGFYPLVELGAITVIDAGNRPPIADEGQDFFNLGASGSEGETITVMTVGARYRIDKDIDVGAGYQFPLSRDEGNRIIDYRLMVDMIYRFSI